MSIKDIAFEETLKQEMDKIRYMYVDKLNKEGGSGEIYEVYSRLDRKARVVKVYKEPLDTVHKNLYNKDVEKLIKFQDETIVKAFEKGIINYEGNQYFYIILDFIDGNSLDEIMPHIFRENNSYAKRLQMFTQALNAIETFRKRYELHFDLHRGNLMLTKENKIMIIDFGSSKVNYTPPNMDIDIYLIKNDLFPFFFSEEEIDKLRGDQNILSIDFKILKNIVTKQLYIEEVGIADLKSIRNNNISYFQKLEQKINNLNKEQGSNDVRYLLIGTSITLIPDEIQILDFDDEKIDEDLIKLYEKFMYTSPGGHIVDFDSFLREMKYHKDFYKSRFFLNRNTMYNEGEHQISSTGKIQGSIIFDCNSGKDFLQKSHYFYDKTKKEELLKASHLYSKLIPYLIMMYLKLAKIIYSTRFSGKFFFSLQILSPFPYFMIFDHWIDISHEHIIIIEKLILLQDLTNKRNTLEIIESMIVEFLRYFGFSKVEAKKRLNIIQDIITTYLLPVFKFEKDN